MKKYLKRLFLLHELGIEIDTDDKDLYHILDNIIKYKSDYVIHDLSSRILFMDNEENTVMQYNKISKDIFISEHMFNSYYEQRLRDISTYLVIQSFLEHRLSLDIKNISLIENYDIY